MREEQRVQGPVVSPVLDATRGLPVEAGSDRPVLGQSLEGNQSR